MNSIHPDASNLYTSLDDIYYYGGQKRRLHVAVLTHNADGPHEMDLQVGDQIAVAGNHWDGYSKGTNLRTKKSGLYPTFKVTNQSILFIKQETKKKKNCLGISKTGNCTFC